MPERTERLRFRDVSRAAKTQAFDVSIKSLLRAESGPLTRELGRVAAPFGLGQLPIAMVPEATATAVCGFCSVGCGLNLLLRDDEAVGLTPATGYPVNRGMACPKGWEALAVLDAADRGTVPLLRESNGKRRPVGWSTALRFMAGRIREIQSRHGNEAVAFLSTGQIATEEMALLGAVAKFGFGMLHGDGNTRQCMATAVAAYKESFGFDAPPYTYADLEESDCLVFVGANPCIAHPILWERVTRNRRRPEIIVVDPRRTETATAATRHLPVKPKGDLALLYALANVFVTNGWIDREFIDAHTTGFDEFAAFLKDYTPEATAAATGLSPAAIRETAGRIRARERVSFWWTMGVNQSHEGTRTAQAIINLALMTGNIGKPGTGANSITGQCNAMGSRLFSNTTNLLGGHDFRNAAHREKVAGVLDMPVERIPDRPGLAYPEIVEGILRGSIKGLWVVATNPAHSWINQTQFRDVLDRLELLVVQDMYHSTETAAKADLYLPAAGWGEKDGTFINSERRIGRIRKVRKAPGESLADFHIFRLVADSAGFGSLFRKWNSPAAVFQLLKRLSAGQPCDFTGIRDYSHLDEVGGIQWPCPQAEKPTPCKGWASERRLFADGHFLHADGKARFVFDAPTPLPEPASDRYPLTLLTGRAGAAVWHTQTRTSKSAVLRKLAPQNAYVEINPANARALKIKPGQTVVVESQRGSVRAKAIVTTAVPVGQVFLPMHDEGTNRLTDAVFDPHSRQPAYKACAVRVRHEE
ncbi:MAG: nitrate reductase [Planctomycetaceae bacterium]